MMMPVALTTALLKSGHGISDVGYVMASSLLPVVIFMLVGGVLADHFSPMRLMIGADIARFFVQTATAIEVSQSHSPLLPIIMLQLIQGTASAMFQPGVASVVPVLVPARIQEGNAALRVGESISSILGPGVGGLLVSAFNPGLAIFLNAITFAISGICLAVILPNLKLTRRGGRPTIVKDLIQGWQEFRSLPWLVLVICVFGMLGLTLFGPLQVLSATILTGVRGSTSYGTLTALQGVGAVMGGFIGLRIHPVRPLRTGALMLLLFTPQLPLLAYNAQFWPLALAMLAAGFGRSIWAVMWSTAVQKNSPPYALNRIYSYDVTGSRIFVPVGRAATGPVASLMGTHYFLLGSFGAGVVGIGILLFSPAVSNLRSHQESGMAPSRSIE